MHSWEAFGYLWEASAHSGEAGDYWATVEVFGYSG